MNYWPEFLTIIVAHALAVASPGPDFALVLGAPARVAGWMCQCGVRLGLRVDDGEQRAVCASCGTTFRRVKDRVDMHGAA